MVVSRFVQLPLAGYDHKNKCDVSLPSLINMDEVKLLCRIDETTTKIYFRNGSNETIVESYEDVLRDIEQQTTTDLLHP